MSANTAIKEGGNPHSFGPVDYLRVASGSDQYALWVPESERALTTKSISKNGIYRALDDGAYGWSSVYVNVPKPESVTGKDGDGDEVVVKPDPETGVLEEEKVPSSIEVITPPTVPSNTYVDGQSIVPGDMVVKAYLASGEEYGVVPNEEITLNPNKAVYDSATDCGHVDDSGVDHSPMVHPNADYDIYAARVSSMYVYLAAVWKGYSLVFSEPVFLVFKGRTKRSCTMEFYSESSFSCTSDYIQAASNPTTTYSSAIEHGGITYHHLSLSYSSAESSTDYDNISVTTVDGHAFNGSDWDVAYLLFNGNITLGSPQTITVSWPRPGDGAILETTFDIRVGPHGGTGED